MSYYEQADKINKKLADAFTSLKVSNPDALYDVVDAMLWFGQVAKFRCRSNAAYDNFSALVLKDIAKVARSPINEANSDFAPLRVVRE